jgi:hypothetical protein
MMQNLTDESLLAGLPTMVMLAFLWPALAVHCAAMGRIQAVFSPTIVVASLLSTAGAGIAAALLQCAEWHLLGAVYGPFGLLLSVAGLLSMGAGIFAATTLGHALHQPPAAQQER